MKAAALQTATKQERPRRCLEFAHLDKEPIARQLVQKHHLARDGVWPR